MQCAIHLCSGRYQPQGSHHKLCHWGLQPHQSGERHQHRDVEFVSCADLARQIRCASFPACVVMPPYPHFPDNRKSTLVFCVNLSHVRELTQTFRDAGIDARYVHSKTPAAERRSLVEGFKAREYPVLVNCGPLSFPPYYGYKPDLQKRFSDFNRGCRYPKYRLYCRCSTDTITECYGSNGSFLMLTPSPTGP